MRPCPQCGYALQNNDKHCPACHQPVGETIGTNVEDTLSVQNNTEPTDDLAFNIMRICVICALFGPPILGAMYGPVWMGGGIAFSVILIALFDVPTMMFGE